ncbi:ABC transporter permease [Paenibacillus hemerocallicola]|uniref:ABC transporter permease n=1 Tax=Paenibacillus hemerocallicola TaxID=1172614 RepID=A0A5C4SXK9_9BACL|nr:ABC transporter permease [Paenibacillus hemerocallicola]TNJ54948.1 ABC transporter permease [Paenibacillus hemerocallicola]
MRAYLQLTLAQLRIFARNRQVLFWSLLFPVFFIGMLGFFLGNGSGISLSGAIIDEDHSTASRQLIRSLQQLNTVIDLQEQYDKEEALKELKQGDRHIVVVVPNGYQQRLSMHDTSTYVDPVFETAPEIATVKAYYDETNMTTSQLALTLLSQVVDGVSKQLANYTPVVTVDASAVQSLHLKYIDFLIPGIIAMMIMSNNLNGVAGQIASWRERGILRRMQSTTLNSATFIAAQITARLVMNSLQVLIVVVVGSTFFGTQVNGAWWLLFLFVALGTLTFMSLGFIIASLAKTPESAGPIAGFVSYPMLFLGGVFFPIKEMPEFMQPIVKLLPISHLTAALRQVMNVGADLSALWPEVALLAGWMIAAFAVSSYLFKWE